MLDSVMNFPLNSYTFSIIFLSSLGFIWSWQVAKWIFLRLFYKLCGPCEISKTAIEYIRKNCMDKRIELTDNGWDIFGSKVSKLYETDIKCWIRINNKDYRISHWSYMWINATIICTVAAQQKAKDKEDVEVVQNVLK